MTERVGCQVLVPHEDVVAIGKRPLREISPEPRAPHGEIRDHFDLGELTLRSGGEPRITRVANRPDGKVGFVQMLKPVFQEAIVSQGLRTQITIRACGIARRKRSRLEIKAKVFLAASTKSASSIRG